MQESNFKKFNHLKIHSQFSICEGAIKIDELKDVAKDLKISSIGLSDTSNLCGAVEFSDKLSKVGTQPIIGTQINFRFEDTTGLLPLFALNLDGYKKIIELSSKSFLENDDNSDPYLIINDLGFSVIEPFKDKFPNRIFNAGVSEQNMMGMAAGIASEKCNVFVYSIANFSTFRCAEQIRNDMDYHNLSITIVSVGSGLSYGNLGYSHHGLQDLSLIRSFPNTIICSPCCNEELVGAMNYIFKNPQPSYLRLDKSLDLSLKIKTQKIKPGK